MAADGILLGVIEDVRFPHSERFCDGNQGHQSIEIILADPIDLETGEPAILNTVRAPQVLFAGWRPAPYWLEVNQRRLFWAYGDRYPVQTIGAGMELILPYKLVPEAPDRLASPGEVVGTLVDFPLIEVVDGVPIAQAQRCGWSIEDAGEYDFAGDIVRTSLHGRDELPGVLQACDPSTTPNTTWAATIDYWAKKTEYYGGGCP